MLAQFLEPLFDRADGYIEIRTIDKAGKARPVFFKDKDDLLAHPIDPTVNVYVGISSRRIKRGIDQNCLTAPYLWLDFDKTTIDAVRYVLDMKGLPVPTFLVNSGNGVHVYYKLKQRESAGLIRSVLAQIAPIVGADTSCVNESRIMRLPGSWNVKGATPLKCEIVESSRKAYDLRADFIEPLGLVLDAPKAAPKVRAQVEKDPALAALHSSKMACIRMIADGVGKGQRNFALGKLTAYLRQQGESERSALKIVKAWNRHNKPEKAESELESEFRAYWTADYLTAYLGCKFTDKRLNEINSSLCPISKCQFHKERGTFKGRGLVIDNYLFKPTVYREIKALDIAILAEIIKSGEKGIGREHLADLVNRHSKDKTLSEALDRLRKHEFIQIIKGIRRSGIVDRYVIHERANYGRGYTIANGAMNQVYIGKRLTDGEYKLYLLLEAYSFGKDEVWPTRETLAATMGLEENTIRKILKSLEHKQYIRRSYTTSETGKTKLFIQFVF